jgi:hypothetical protein
MIAPSSDAINREIDIIESTEEFYKLYQSLPNASPVYPIQLKSPTFSMNSLMYLVEHHSFIYQYPERVLKILSKFHIETYNNLCEFRLRLLISRLSITKLYLDIAVDMLLWLIENCVETKLQYKQKLLDYILRLLKVENYNRKVEKNYNILVKYLMANCNSDMLRSITDALRSKRKVSPGRDISVADYSLGYEDSLHPYFKSSQGTVSLDKVKMETSIETFRSYFKGRILSPSVAVLEAIQTNNQNLSKFNGSLQTIVLKLSNNGMSLDTLHKLLKEAKSLEEKSILEVFYENDKVDMVRFTTDADYREKCVLELAETLDLVILDKALQIGAQHNIPCHLLFAQHFKWLFEQIFKDINYRKIYEKSLQKLENYKSCEKGSFIAELTKCDYAFYYSS